MSIDETARILQVLKFLKVFINFINDILVTKADLNQ